MPYLSQKIVIFKNDKNLFLSLIFSRFRCSRFLAVFEYFKKSFSIPFYPFFDTVLSVFQKPIT